MKYDKDSKRTEYVTDKRTGRKKDKKGKAVPSPSGQQLPEGSEWIKTPPKQVPVDPNPKWKIQWHNKIYKPKDYFSLFAV